MIHFGSLIQQFFCFVLNPIESEYKGENTSHNEDIIFLLAFLEDYSYDFAANFGIIRWFDDYFMLKSILFYEDKGSQSVEMMLCHVSLKNVEFVVQSLYVDLFAIPKQSNNACNLYVIIVYFANVGWSYFVFLIAGSQVIRRLHNFEIRNNLFKLLSPWLAFSISRDLSRCLIFGSSFLKFCLSILLSLLWNCFLFCFWSFDFFCEFLGWLIIFEHFPYISYGIPQFFVSLNQI